MIKKIIIKNSINYSVIDYELLNKIIYDVGKSYKERGHFALAYLVGSNKLRAYLFFIYG